MRVVRLILFALIRLVITSLLLSTVIGTAVVSLLVCQDPYRWADRLAALKGEDMVIEPAPGVVPIEREAGGLIIVKAIFTGPTGSTTCKALLDTGATFSLIPPRVARKIGVKAQGKTIIVGIKSRQFSPVTYTDVKLGAVRVKRAQT